MSITSDAAAIFTDTGIGTPAAVRNLFAEVDSAIASAGNISTEASTRAAADTTLQNNITGEAATRAAADTTLQTSLTTEASTRAASDATLQVNINTVTANLNTEISARAAGDTAEASARTAAIAAAVAAETTRAEAAEATNASAIGVEVGRAEAAEAALSAAVSSESNARATADATLTTNLGAEVTARTSGDTNLQNGLAAETATRAAADTTLQNNLNAEAAARAAEDLVLQNSVAAEISARAAAEAALQVAVSAEASTRATADTAIANSVTVEASTRASADAAETARALAAEGLLGAAIMDPPSRPGDNPGRFTSTLAGAPMAVVPLSSAAVAPSANGTVYRVIGAFVAATRIPQWLEPSRIIAQRWAWSRFAAPTDPAGDAVQCGIVWLDQNFNSLGTTVVSSETPTAGPPALQIVSARVPSQSGDPVTIAAPSGAVYWRPYIQTYGLDGVTDLVALTSADITDAAAYSPNLAALTARVTALETEVATLNPLSAGTPNGLAVLDSSGHLLASELSVAVISSILSSLPTTQPSTSGAWWLNGTSADGYTLART